MLASIHNLSKFYVKKTANKEEKSIFSSFLRSKNEKLFALNDVSFEINRGDFIGLLGPNGAGKSTLIKIMTGVLTPSTGHVTINGVNPQKKRQKLNRMTGVVFGQKSQLWWNLPLIDTFKLLKVMYDVDDAKYESNLEYFNKILGLKEFMDRPVRQLSLGQRMRAEIATAFMHDPSLIYLDEPTIGLDSNAKANIRDFLYEVNRVNKTTIVLTTHDMGDIENLCSRLLIVDKGKLIYDGSVEDLKRKYGEFKTLTVDYDGNCIPNSNISPDLKFIKLVGSSRALYKYSKSDFNLNTLVKTLSSVEGLLDFNVNEESVEELVNKLY